MQKKYSIEVLEVLSCIGLFQALRLCRQRQQQTQQQPCYFLHKQSFS